MLCRHLQDSVLSTEFRDIGKKRRFLVLPVPYRSQELRHINTFLLHLNHPRMFRDMPRRGSAIRILFKTSSDVSTWFLLGAGGKV